MNNNRRELDWQELKDMWENSTQTKKISIQISTLVEELKDKVSPFEKKFIKSDLATLKANWNQFKGGISQFEKESINKDVAIITRLLRGFLNYFKKK